MRLFIRYCAGKWRTWIILLLFAVILTVSFLLYRLPVAAVLYPMGLCVICGIPILVSDYVRFRKKHTALRQMSYLSAEVMETCVPCDTLIESDYAALIAAMREEIIRTKDEDTQRYREMVEFYTVWAHQIKTPIAAMKLTLQNEDSDLSRQLTSDLFRTQQYVDMVLAFLRLGSDATDYVFREYALDDIIRGGVRKFASEFISRKLSLTYEPVSMQVVTDEKWLTFVIEQLLSNALKYTHEGGITVGVRDKKLYITDTGMGIAPEDLPRIFEKGYTGYNGRKDKNASGLGLYLCRRICDNLGFTIAIESRMGAGTTVTVDMQQRQVNME